MGSSAIGSTTQPIYWNGSAFANTSYTIGKSVPSDAKFTDTTYSANNGVGLSGTTFYNSGVRATTINGNYLRVNTNGTNADLTIPYATSAGSATTIMRLFRKTSEDATASGYYKIATITHVGWAYCSFTILASNSYDGNKFNTIFDCWCGDTGTTLHRFALNITGGTDISSKLSYLVTKNGDNIAKIEVFMLCSRYEHPEFFLIAQCASPIMALNTTDWGATPDKAAGATMTGNAGISIVASALISKNIGSSTQPVYFDANGEPVVCTSYANASVASAGKLTTARTINGTSFDGSANITTENWGTARNISIADSDSTNTGSAVSVNGSAAVTLKLPATIKATLSGNAATATTASKLSTVSKTAWGQTFWTSDGVPTSISGALSSVTNITMSGYIKIGDAYLSYDSTNNAIRVSKNADGTGAANFYALGGVSALGASEGGGGGGQGDVTWALLANNSDTRPIALSHLTGALTDYATQSWVSTNFALKSDIPTLATLSWSGYSSGSYNGSEAKTISIPNNTNQLTNGAGFVTSSGVTSVATGTGLTGGTITSTGTISINSTYQTYISNGNTAYGWGNHANAGYLTGITSSMITTALGYTPANSSSLSSYLPLSGGTMTGIINKAGGNLLNFRTGHDNYNAIAAYYTTGNEALVFGFKNAVTSFIVKSGVDLTNISNWQEGTIGTPSIQIKGQCLYVNSAIANNVTPSYNFYVGGTMGISGQITSTVANGTAPFAVSSTTKVTNLNADYIDGLDSTSLLRKVTVANNTTNDFNTFENMTLTGRGDPTTGASLVHAPWSGTGPAGGYGVLTYLWGSYGTQMAWGYSDNHIYIRYKTYNSGAAWSDSWSTIALTSDIPTKVSQLTNDVGYVTSSGVTSVATGTGLTGGTITSSGTISIDSTYQTYISNGNTAYGYFTNGVANKSACLSTDGIIQSQAALDSFHEGHKLKYGIWNNFKPTGLYYPNGIIIDGGYTGANYGFQIAIDDDSTYKIHLRQKNASGWADWKQIPMGDGTGASGTWGINITGSATSAGNATNDSDGYAINSTYLKKSGGTMTGNLAMGANSVTGTAGTIGFYGNFHIDSANGWAMYLNYYDSHDILMVSGGGNVGIGTVSPSYKLHVSGDIYATGGVTSLSDARHKTIMGDTKLRVEQIADMPAITYKWIDRRDNDIHVGSIAQNWQRILPEVVSVANDLEGTLSINYGVAAMIASIVTAKKVVDHEARIKALESECERLREENKQLRLKIA